MVDDGTIQIYTYEGKTQCFLKLPNVSKGDILYEKTVAISNDTTAIRDRFDPKTIHIFETATARTAGDGKIVHSVSLTKFFFQILSQFLTERRSKIDLKR